jgi:amino acid transporter
MGGVRRHKRVLGWIAIIALLSNVLAAGSLVPSMAASLVDDVLGPFVICTADGAKAAPGNGGSGRHAPSDHCPACVTVKQSVLAVAFVFTAIAFSLAPASRPARLQSRSPAVHVSLGGIRSRAPPLFA